MRFESRNSLIMCSVPTFSFFFFCFFKRKRVITLISIIWLICLHLMVDGWVWIVKCLRKEKLVFFRFLTYVVSERKAHWKQRKWTWILKGKFINTCSLKNKILINRLFLSDTMPCHARIVSISTANLKFDFVHSTNTTKKKKQSCLHQLIDSHFSISCQ